MVRLDRGDDGVDLRGVCSQVVGADASEVAPGDDPVTVALTVDDPVVDVQVLLADLKSKGMQVNEVKDPAAFRTSGKSVYDQFRPAIGPELMDAALKAVR